MGIKTIGTDMDDDDGEFTWERRMADALAESAAARISDARRACIDKMARERNHVLGAATLRAADRANAWGTDIRHRLSVRSETRGEYLAVYYYCWDGTPYLRVDVVSRIDGANIILQQKFELLGPGRE